MGLIKTILYHISNRSFLPLFKNQSIFPYYHLVRDSPVAHIDQLYPYKNSTQFKVDLDWLTAHYQPIHPSVLLTTFEHRNRFLLTFDDGLQEVYSVIYPMLKERNLSAIFFINPQFVDNQDGLYKHFISVILSRLQEKNYPSDLLKKISAHLGFSYTNAADFKRQFLRLKYADQAKIEAVLTWLNIDKSAYLAEHQPYITKAQIQEMLDDGFYFGGHTLSHPPLGQLTFEEQKREIIGSMAWLKENFKIEYAFFAFPFTDKSISKRLLQDMLDYDPNIRIFGNAGLKKDMDTRIIQRFSLENPTKKTEKVIVMENLYKYFNKIVGHYTIKRA